MRSKDTHEGAVASAVTVALGQSAQALGKLRGFRRSWMGIKPAVLTGFKEPRDTARENHQSDRDRSQCSWLESVSSLDG